jgi:hypothetical protein
MNAVLKKIGTQCAAGAGRGYASLEKMHNAGYGMIENLFCRIDTVIDNVLPNDAQEGFANGLRAFSGLAAVVASSIGMVALLGGVALSGLLLGAPVALAAAVVAAPAVVFTLGALNAQESSPAFKSVVFRFLEAPSDFSYSRKVQPKKPEEEFAPVDTFSVKDPLKKEFSASSVVPVTEEIEEKEKSVVAIPAAKKLKP